ncbi:MAG: ABC transporter permease [Acidobacteriia bacterium]|nr:ABC transporter permease [Terriglobia bacterium]
MPDWQKILRARLALLALPPEREAEVIEELARDLEESWAAAKAAGADEQEAMAAALEELGDQNLLDRDITRAVRTSLVGTVAQASRAAERNAPLGTSASGSKVRDFIQDLRYAVRLMIKAPGLAAVAISILALGIAANIAIFSVVNGVLLKPLPYRDPGQLMMVWAKNPKGIPRNQVSAPNFLDWKNRNRAFEDMAAFTGEDFTLTGLGEPERLPGVIVSPNLFSVLGIGPAIGRVFLGDEGRMGGAQAVILSYGLWQRRFGGDPAVLGRSITLNGHPQVVVGVMPREESFLVDGIQIWAASDFGDLRESRAANRLQVLARLKHGITQAEAQAEMDAIAAHLAGEYPKTNKDWGATVITLEEQVTGEVRPSLLILLGTVGLFLLIACANVANLLLARAISRQKEIAVRAAMGANRGRICRQLLTESLFLSVLSGSLGVFLGTWGIRLLLKLKPENLPRSSDIGIDLTVLAFTLLATLLTGLLFGLAPAIHALSLDMNSELKQSGRHAGEAGRASKLRRALLMAEVALAVILLNGAGLLIHSFLKLTHVNPGFEAENVLTMDITLPSSKYQASSLQAEFFDDLLRRLQTIPDVYSAAGVFPAPLAGGIGFLRFGYSIEGRTAEVTGPSDRVYVRWVTPGYFQTMGIPLRAGRDFDSHDSSGSPLVVVIDETLVRRDFARENPLGKQVMPSFGPRVWRRIVGVVGGVHQTALDVDAGPHLYLPYPQMPLSDMTVVVKTRSDPRALAGAVKAQVFGIDPDQAVSNLAPMEERLAKSVSFRRFSVVLLGLFAALALLIAAVGVYSVMIHSVSRRTHEMGVRIALGAKPRDLYRLVIGDGMLIVAVGVGLGVVGALALMRLLTALLYGVSPSDPLAMLTSGVALAAAAIAGCYWPARRATRVDPTQALRSE